MSTPPRAGDVQAGRPGRARRTWAAERARRAGAVLPGETDGMPAAGAGMPGQGWRAPWAGTDGEGWMITLARAAFTDDEIDGLYRVCRSQPDYWRISGDQDPATMTRDSIGASLRADAAAEDCETLVARNDNGNLVGFVELLRRHPVDGHPWIGLLLVDASVGRQGHGREIVAAVEEKFRRAGARAVRLGVLVGNEAARAFWTRLGYREIDVRPDLARGRSTVVLEKRLAPDPGA